MPLKKKLWWFGVLVAALGSLVMLRAQSEQYAWSGLVRDDLGDDTTEANYYDVLQVAKGASSSEIRAAYKKLALKYHPDRNANCGAQCDEMTAKINRAYGVLSDAAKRAVYDDTFGSFENIPSSAMELSRENFDELVIQSRGMFLVQVYTEWYKECKTFSPVWEEAVTRLGPYVGFGRVHGARQVSVVRRLGAAVKDYPTVLAYVNGRYLRTYPTITKPQELFDLVLEDYPRRNLWIATDESLSSVDSRMRSQSPRLPLLMVASQKTTPGLLLSKLAQDYEGILQFAHVYPKPLAARGGRKRGGRARFLSKALSEVFGVPKFDTLPKLVHVSTEGEAQLMPQHIDKESLRVYTRQLVASMAPELSAWTYISVCARHTVVCVIHLDGCAESSTNALTFLKVVREISAQFERVKDQFEPRWLQLAYLNTRHHPATRGLCLANSSRVVAVYDDASSITEWNGTGSLSAETLWPWVQDLFNRDIKTEVHNAPVVVPPPPQHNSLLAEIVESFSQLDWNDPDVQLNTAIITAIVGGIFACRQMGIKGFVTFIFALSIFGGALQFILAAGLSSPQRRARRS